MPDAAPVSHMLLKSRGAVCNLACKYCYFLSRKELYPGSSFHMSEEVLEELTHQYLESAGGAEVTSCWQGGEPTLMGLGFFERALELQEKYRLPGVRVGNTFQTNGCQHRLSLSPFHRSRMSPDHRRMG